MAQTNLVDPTLLFEFAISISKFDEKPSSSNARKSRKANSRDDTKWSLGDVNRLPHFAAMNGSPSHSTVYAAWSESGLYFQVCVTNKKKLPRFVQARGGFSDGLRVWIDTRCSPGIHRATRFCHCFHFFPGQPNPTESSLSDNRPHGILDEIPRSRDQPAAVDPSCLNVRCEFNRGGYTLQAYIPSNCLTGYSPVEFDRIRLFYDVVDSELGTQSMVLGPELRYAEDPSHWVQASLLNSIASKRR